MVIAVNSIGRRTFFTQSKLKGWDEHDRPIWEEMLSWDTAKLPAWGNWHEVREGLIRPLCSLARSVAVFEQVWVSQDPEVLAVRDFIAKNFQLEGKTSICRTPQNLVDNALFWTAGGSSSQFVIAQVMEFDEQVLAQVLAILEREHKESFLIKPRTGGMWSPINKYCRQLVQRGSVALLATGSEAELVFSVGLTDKVAAAGEAVAARAAVQARLVKEKILAAKGQS